MRASDAAAAGFYGCFDGGRIAGPNGAPPVRPAPRLLPSQPVYNSLVSTGPQLIRPAEPAERNWLPLAIAAFVVLAVVAGLIVFLGRGKSEPRVTPISAQADPYAANLPITGLAMSESSNLTGGKVTYLDGHIANRGAQTVTGVSIQVLFRNYAHEVAQNETQPLQVIRTRDPEVDIEPLAVAPLEPGDERDFRLIFDTVADSWNGDYPELRIVRVEGR